VAGVVEDRVGHVLPQGLQGPLVTLRGGALPQRLVREEHRVLHSPQLSTHEVLRLLHRGEGKHVGAIREIVDVAEGGHDLLRVGVGGSEGHSDAALVGVALAQVGQGRGWEVSSGVAGAAPCALNEEGEKEGRGDAQEQQQLDRAAEEHVCTLHEQSDELNQPAFTHADTDARTHKICHNLIVYDTSEQ
jgi:hypothetical protein